MNMNDPNIIEIPFYRVNNDGIKTAHKITLDKDTRVFIRESIDTDLNGTLFTDNPSMSNIPYIIDQKKLLSDIIENLDADNGLELDCMKTIRDYYIVALRYLQMRDTYSEETVELLKKEVALRFFSVALTEKNQKAADKNSL